MKPRVNANAFKDAMREQRRLRAEAEMLLDKHGFVEAVRMLSGGVDEAKQIAVLIDLLRPPPKKRAPTLADRPWLVKHAERKFVKAAEDAAERDGRLTEIAKSIAEQCRNQRPPQDPRWQARCLIRAEARAEFRASMAAPVKAALPDHIERLDRAPHADIELTPDTKRIGR